MKKVILFVLSLYFVSCAVIPKYQVKHNFIDYGKYLDNNFYITESNSINSNYYPVGNFTVIVKSGDVANGIINENPNYGDTLTYKFADINDAMQEVYSKGIQLKADGALNFKIEYFSDGITDKYIVTGMYFKWTR